MTGVRPNTELSTELKRVFNEGGDGELIAAIKERRWRELRRLGPRERVLCGARSPEKVSATAPRVTVEDWDALRSLGFDEMGCLEVAYSRDFQLPDETCRRIWSGATSGA
jgi:hypothetical protein